jgi:hypothetical protein
MLSTFKEHQELRPRSSYISQLATSFWLQCWILCGLSTSKGQLPLVAMLDIMWALYIKGGIGFMEHLAFIV